MLSAGAWCGDLARLVMDRSHTFATSLLNGWGSKPWCLEEVSALLGHRDVTTTRRHYARVLPSRLHEAAGQAEVDITQTTGDA